VNGFRWDRLPEAVLRLLLPGTIGKTHLLQIARAAFEEGKATGNPLCMALGAEALSAAWESDILDPVAAGQAADVLARAGGDPALRRCAERVRDAGEPAPPQLARLVSRGDMERVKQYISNEFDGKRVSPGVLSRIAPLAAESGEAAWCLALAENLESAAGPAGLAFCADMRFLTRDLEAAAELYGQALQDMPSPGVRSRLAGCFLRMGGADRAAAEYRAVLAQRPWMVNARLALHDLETGRARERELPPGRTAVLIYTCDKADDLARCLEALAAGEIGQGALVVLDNGSCDHTPDVLAAFQDRLGADRLQTIRLPVNIGAPAARNWLARSEALEGFTYAAFVDDDALVPPDWLQRLGAAVKHYPEAGVWGCKVADAAEPAMVQNADLHLRPVDPEDQTASHVRMNDLHLQAFDTGLLDYMRPCASVTGCCHLITVRDLTEGPDFHIGFSPTQFDDLDRDLIRFAQGGAAVYTGHLGVAHLKRTGKAATQQVWASGNAMGNRVKLESRRTPREVESMVRRQTRMLLDDLLSKLGED
jgi:hypothetical protein